MGSEEADEDIDTDRWMELGDLGVASSLRRSGASQAEVNRMTTLLMERPDRRPIARTEDFVKVLGIKDGLCVLLATLGRDAENTGSAASGSAAPVIDNLNVSERCLQVDVGSRTTTFQNIRIGVRELRALWVNLARNPKIRKLTIYTELRVFKSPANCANFENALMSNTFLRGLNVYSSSIQGLDPFRKKYGWPPGSNVVHERVMPVESLGRLVTQLGKKESLEFLGIMTFPEDVDSLADVVAATTTTLRGLTVIYVAVPPGNSDANGGNSVERLANALRKNTSLESFEFAVTRQSPDLRTTPMENWASTLLAPFTQEEGGSNDHRHRHSSTNCTVNRLSFSEFPSSAVGILCSVLRTNKTLKSVGLRHSHLSPEEWAQEILASLRGNGTLEHLDLSGSSGLTGDIVFDALMSLLQYTKTKLKAIALSETELQSKVGIVNEELRINQEYRTNLASETMIAPKAGRIVLCGFPFAGKTRICKTLQRQELSCSTSLKGFLQRHPRLRQLLFGRGVHQELYDRTRGLDITVIGEAPHTTSIWDFAGQREFYVLHDYLFPNAGNSCFLYVCSARHPPDRDGVRAVKVESDIRDEISYWMRFIASNSKHVRDRHGRVQRPSVTFVMTNLDALGNRERRRFESLAEAVVGNFKADFRRLLDISDTVEFVDARSPEAVENLFAASKGRLARTLADSTEYEVCSKVRDALQRWRSNHPSEPILTLRQAGDIICAQGSLRGQLQNHGEREVTVPSNPIETPFEAGLKVVLKYLNDVGDVIFVDGLNFVIVQTTWFGLLLGYLIDPFRGNRAAAGTGILGCCKVIPEDTGPLYHENGFVRRSALDAFLKRSLKRLSFNQAIPSGNLIDLMIHLDMCFEELCGNGGSGSELDTDPRFFFPALLDGDPDSPSTALQWTLQFSPVEKFGVCYVGRRLECSDKSLTFLSPGFFPRLQVVLLNYFREQNWLETSHFAVLQNTIRFANDGMEVIVEYSENFHFVDVMVQSTKGFQQTAEFIKSHVERKILEFCSSPQGCPGVNLVEAVIRPKCVQILCSCKDRKDQSVLVSTLENREPGYRHTWRDPIPGVGDSDVDFADVLLYGHRISHLSRELPTSSRRSGRVPKNFYVTIEDVKAIQKLEAKMNPAKKIPVKLHLLCDGFASDRPHQIKGQPGRVLLVPESCKDYNFPILKFAVNMLWEGTKIAAGVFNVIGPKQVDERVEKLFKTPDLDIDVNTLKKITMIAGESKKVPTANVLRMLESYLHIFPGTKWLEKFLRLEEEPAFYNDFQLRAATDPSSDLSSDRSTDLEEISWLCDKHFVDSCQAWT